MLHLFQPIALPINPMIKKLIVAALVLISTSAAAHELTPTYPKLKPSYVDGISVTTMHLFNRRTDVEYYKIDVYDVDWNPIAYAASESTVQVKYLGHKYIDIYIRDTDKDSVEFICTTSRLVSDNIQSSGIKSRICSRVK